MPNFSQSGHPYHYHPSKKFVGEDGNKLFVKAPQQTLDWGESRVVLQGK